MDPLKNNKKLNEFKLANLRFDGPDDLSGANQGHHGFDVPSQFPVLVQVGHVIAHHPVGLPGSPAGGTSTVRTVTMRGFA